MNLQVRIYWGHYGGVGVDDLGFGPSCFGPGLRAWAPGLGSGLGLWALGCDFSGLGLEEFRVGGFRVECLGLGGLGLSV